LNNTKKSQHPHIFLKNKRELEEEMSQLPSTPTSLAPLSPTPLNTSSSFFMQQQQYDGLISPTTTTNVKEEISTIFVVGFPEDMQEREFQNMFMFSPGFEAATLKVPSSTNGTKDVSQDDDYLMNNNNGRKQIVSFSFLLYFLAAPGSFLFSHFSHLPHSPKKKKKKKKKTKPPPPKLLIPSFFHFRLDLLNFVHVKKPLMLEIY
jgi:hypothetical protein